MGQPVAGDAGVPGADRATVAADTSHGYGGVAMIDQCHHCIVRGDLRACISTPCGHHRTWYAHQLQDKINAQAELIDSLQEALKEAEARIEGLLRERG